MQDKLIFTQGNLYKGYPYGVVITKNFDVCELHGPFATENEAWNYGMEQARTRLDFVAAKMVKIETPQVKGIATQAEANAVLQQYIVTGTGEPKYPHGIWDRSRQRFVDSYVSKHDAETRRNELNGTPGDARPPCECGGECCH